MKSISDSILQEPIDFTVTVNRRSFLHKIRLRRSKKVFVIYPLCLGTLLLIAKELTKFEEFTEKGKDINFDAVVKAIIGNSKLLSKVVSLAIWNRKYSKIKLFRYFQNIHIKMISEYIEGNLDSSEILVLSNAVINQMEIEHFLACMGSIQGMEIVTDKVTQIEPSKEEISGK